jgi:sporulation protein YlmC with PRC-barrel domain
MNTKFLMATVIGAALSTAAMAANEATQTASGENLWQASKFIHMNVYNDQNQKVGDIEELLLDKNGKVDSVAISVGGFLGIGTHDVAVKFDQLKWVDTPVPTTTSSNAPAVGTTGSNASSTSEIATKRTYPDHAVLNETKAQLKAMPEFDYSK